MTDVDGEIQRIRRIVESIASKGGGFEKIYLFGSRARGDGTEKSDYDVCVYADDHVSLSGIAGLMVDLSEELKSKVDVVDAAALKDEDVSSVRSKGTVYWSMKDELRPLDRIKLIIRFCD